jgi:chromosome segregation ATPase
MMHGQEVVVGEDESPGDDGASGSPEIKDAVLTIASKLNKDVEAASTHLGNVETLQHDLLQQLAQSIERWEQGIQRRLDEDGKQIESLETKIGDLTQRLSNFETTATPSGVELRRLGAELHRLRLRVTKIILFILLAAMIGIVIGIRR